MSTTSDLIRRGGWAIDDAQARHRAHPDTFWLPPAEELARLGPGASVRLIFAVLDQADPIRDGRDPYGPGGAPNLTVQHERMWLWVERVEGDALVGILKNVPFATHTRLLPGARVRFRREDVIDLDLDRGHAAAFEEELAAMRQVGFPLLEEAAALEPERPDRAPTIAPSQAEACARAGARPERPWPFARALLGKGVVPGRFPVYGVRSRPRPDRRICGWSIWSAHADMERAVDAEGFEIVDVKDLYARHVEAWAHLALPPGWAFVLGPDGYEDVYQEPTALED